MKKAFLQISGGGAASKLLGAVRELLLARFFGTGAAADSVRASHSLTLAPIHLYTRIIQSCFIPLYARYEKEDVEKAGALFVTMIFLSGLLGLLTAALLFLLAPVIVRVFVPGFSGTQVTLTISMLRILSAGIPFYVYCMTLGALGAAQRDYLIPAIRPGIQNTGMIAMILVAVVTRQPLWISGGFVLAYLFLSLFATAILRRRNLFPPSFSLDIPLMKEAGRTIWNLSRPLIFLSILLEGNILVERFVTSLMGTGRMAALAYARFLSETAHFLIAMPLGLMSLSIFAKYTDDETRLGADKLLALLSLGFVPLSAFLFLNGGELIAAIFLRGEFDNSSLALTERALIGLSVGLWLYSGSVLLQRILNARLRNGVVLRAEGVSVAVSIAFNLLFYRQLGIMVIGFGIALGSLCSMTYYMVVMGLRLRLVRKSACLLAAGLPLYLMGAHLLGEVVEKGYASLAIQTTFACLLWGLIPLISRDLRELIRSKLRR